MNVAIRNKRVSKDHSPSVKMLRGCGRWASPLMVALSLTACGGIDSRPVGTVGHIKGFAGLVAADEPRAVVVGRDVLSAGGTAADAATAMYFTLAVTYPSNASLGGGGSCIVHDIDKNKTEVIDFSAIASTQAAAAPSAVPANPRGFFALHAKYGLLRWDSLLAEPERLARSGTPVSRALVSDLARSVQILARDPAMRAIFLRSDGGVLREGDVLVQPDLALVLSNIRRNTGDFYLGGGARDLVTAVRAAGGGLTLEDLRDYRPQWRETVAVPVGNDVAHFAPPPAVGSAMAAQMVGLLWNRWDSTPEDERPHLLAEMSARAYADRARWMLTTGWSTEDAALLVSADRLETMAIGYAADHHVPVAGVKGPPAEAQTGTSFVVMDGKGGAVACGVTSFGLFGNGRVAPGTGIVLAGVPGLNGPPAVTSMLVVNTNSKETHFAGTATGGGTAPAALVISALATMVENKPLADALALPRVVHPGNPDVAFVENTPYAMDPALLQSRGHQVAGVAMPSRVEALYCPRGHKGSELCQVATDPRGFGMATVAGKR
ncbi:Gamma-glutamyltranspeptidase [Candidatus Terasakiella magnetica]|nr:Gamma-glutamyltranspeptidase [Candidatus Terasakiella magnetica]